MTYLLWNFCHWPGELELSVFFEVTVPHIHHYQHQHYQAVGSGVRFLYYSHHAFLHDGLCMRDQLRHSHNGSKYELQHDRNQNGQSHKSSKYLNLPLVSPAINHHSETEMEMSFIESDCIKRSNKDWYQ